MQIRYTQTGALPALTISCPASQSFKIFLYSCKESSLHKPMASSKRSWEGHIVNHSSNPNVPGTADTTTASMASAAAAATTDDTASAFQSVFENFRSELDQHHDRRERVIKASRDITALSKKMCVVLV